MYYACQSNKLHTKYVIHRKIFKLPIKSIKKYLLPASFKNTLLPVLQTLV